MSNVYGLMFLEGYFATPSALRRAAEDEQRNHTASVAALDAPAPPCQGDACNSPA